MAAQLTVEQVFCYICRGVLLEPVKLPCKHVFCTPCFNSCMGETSYSCPLCRLRVSNWVRSTRKSGSLVDQNLWNQIRRDYPNEVRAKLEGKDDGLDARLQASSHDYPVISATGEVAKEYSNFLKNYQEEREKERQREEEESLQLIAKFQEEERQRLEMENTRKEQERLSLELIKRIQDDEENERRQQERKSLEFIKLLQEEEKKSRPTRRSTAVVARPRRSLRSQQAGNSKTATTATVGPIDKFTTRNPELKARITLPEPNNDSRDSIAGELNSHFKPIRSAPQTPPKTHTAVIFHPHKRTPDTLKSFEFEPRAPHSLVQSPFSAFCPKQPDGVLKEINLGENSDSNSFTEGEVPPKCVLQSGLGEENQMSVLPSPSD